MGNEPLAAALKDGESAAEEEWKGCGCWREGEGGWIAEVLGRDQRGCVEAAAAATVEGRDVSPGVEKDEVAEEREAGWNKEEGKAETAWEVLAMEVLAME